MFWTAFESETLLFPRSFSDSHIGKDTGVNFPLREGPTKDHLVLQGKVEDHKLEAQTHSEMAGAETWQEVR